ncbi:DNA mismatch repair protein mutL [Morus notabilis]|uniref:DNA mismatch repair protein mutL n=1 Tax=Morus notabilis TaxID=981085 RepID=W9RKQ1_9ROSA|nr:DNA mismatch repair protein mutL [Morus notabilis]
MRSIRPMPEAVRTSVRSGTIVFDIARVVEELVFNSLDAGASKVSVFIGVSTCYVRVEDDGSGITRDGLELLGERYATSKFDQLDDKNTKTGSFGFRGEALASISDVSMLEILTKACGRPNGYRKVMKGSKCLYLGICDDRKDVGTTVVVRDLFYNQPVRRKYIQSSPKKVLQSVKKCVLRIALVHSKLSFKVVDLESEDVLLCTHPSSPMSLMTSCFGIEVSTSLHELNISAGKIKLSGYISGPCDNLTIKDWVPVLTLLDEAIQQLWKGNISYRESIGVAADIMAKDLMLHGDEITMYAEDLGDENFSGNSTIEKKNSTIQSHLASPGLVSSHLKILNKEEAYLSHGQQDITPIRSSSNYFKEKENETDFTIQTEKFGQSWELPLPKCIAEVSGNCENEIYISDNNISSVKDHFFVNEVSNGERCSGRVDNSNFTSWWGNDSFEGSLNVSSGSGIAKFTDCPDLIDDVKMIRPFLKSCSLRRSLPHESSLFTDAGHDIRSDNFKMKKLLTESYDRVDISEIDGGNLSFDFLSKTSWQDQTSSFQHFPKVSRKSDLSAEFDSLPVKSIPFYEESLDGNDDFSSHSIAKVDTIGSDHFNLDSKWRFLTSDSFSQGSPWEVEDYTDINIREDSEENDCRFSYDVLEKRSSQENCTTRSNSGLDDAVSGRFLQSYKLKNNFSPECIDILTDERESLSLGSHGKSHKSIAIHKSQRDKYNEEIERNSHFSSRRSRSCSAPPFYRSKRRFFALNCHFSSKADNGPAYQDMLSVTYLVHPNIAFRLDLKNMQELKEDNKKVNKDVRFEQSACFDIQDAALLKETISDEFQDSPNHRTKWRNCCPQTANNNKLPGIHDQNTILDVSSGYLHLAGDLLVPESINKNCLEDAIVLQQVDKKFIPVVAGRTLAVVDQHAADERIRLEELRQKVLSGEGKTITFLEAERELTLPEAGHQLLHNYAEEIKEWGWICNIHAQDSGSFKRSLNLLNKQPAVVTLIAVPCILGVNLSDLDLMEFLQQLADTDGSSMIPPSVLRILNSKACRGAIMFGDSLLPSECSLIIAELKQTALCFQCAHGRPTTVPLVNLEALHKQIAKIALMNDDLNGLWHGLCRHELTIERAAQRLSLATS